MRQISSSITFEIEPGETVPMMIAHSTRLTVEGAAVWATRSNDVEDYWLRPGGALHLRRGERLWLSVDGEQAARVRFVAPLAPTVMMGAWLGSLAQRVSARLRGGLRTV